MARATFIAVALIVSAVACGGSEGESDLSDPRQLEHVELFGYYSSAGYLQETLRHSNMVWGGPSSAAAAKAAGIRAVVDVQHIFRIAAPVRPSTGVIEADWLKLAGQLEPDLSAVAALYPSDEPYWNGFRNGVPFDEVRRRLEEAARLIRATPGFEHMPIATIFADPELDWIARGEATNPAGYDWVGFDRYCAPLLLLQRRTALFLSLLRPEQRIIAVPDAMLPTALAHDVSGLERRVEYWLSWVAENPRVIAIAPFIYWTGGDSTLTWTGARDMPSVRDRYAQIGRWIVDASIARALGDASAEGGTSAP